MRFVPDGVHRERVGTAKPAVWYVIWLGRPHADGSTIIGRTKRLRRHLHHRCFPASGGWPADIKGHTAGIEWLLEVHGRQAGESD